MVCAAMNAGWASCLGRGRLTWGAGDCGPLIGDGDAEEGGRPFAFYLPPEQDLDIGLVKFFVSTRYVDLSWIAQDSPFEGGYPYGGANRQVPPRMVLANDGWGTTLITVLQRRPAA